MGQHKIEYGLRFEPRSCPDCGAGPEDLIVATKAEGLGYPTRHNPRPRVENLGYDCAKCGAELRHKKGARP